MKDKEFLLFHFSSLITIFVIPYKPNDMKQTVLIISFLLLMSSFVFSHVYVKKDVFDVLNLEDIEKLQENFYTTIDLAIPEYENSASRNHAKQILKDFVKKNPIKSYKHNHSGTSKDGSVYIIGTLMAGSKSYRTYFLIKKFDEVFYIVQLQIEEE